ncbi:uncharacterized protein H6S33_009798 [Morchella sextelata]|uniref:uncharacterized protein n=1 Tax=Morchella sextelata TaxID=1174677 RepID=UPI001D03907D|nr:uncharacterized protein H6S33_009798 [Morchella sextelata]KAH0602347.1 hypothetical protein H6S33_009798 [Morchella sextelata]
MTTPPSVLEPDWSMVWESHIPLTSTSADLHMSDWSAWSASHVSSSSNSPEALQAPLSLPLPPLQPPLQPQQQQQQPCQHPTTTVAAPPSKRRKSIGGMSVRLPIRKSILRNPNSSPAPRRTPKTKAISSHIPFEIWLEIFSYCSPAQLAKLRRVNSSFKGFIDDEKIWAKRKFVSTQRGNYYGLGGGDPCYWKDEVTAFKIAYDEKKSQEAEFPGILATFIEFEKDQVKVQMDLAVKMCDFERIEAVNRREELAEIRRQRLISIPEKCKEHFEPPIPEGVLELIPSYQAALKAGNILTDRGWKTLVTKITTERTRAEAQYQQRQQEKEQAHRKYTSIRRKVRKEEALDYRNLRELKSAMPKLLKYAKDFIRREGGVLLLESRKVQSFIMETFKYCRRTWYEKNPKNPLPFRAAYFIWEEVIEELFNRGGFDVKFCCEYCTILGTWEEIIFHLAMDHQKKPGMQGLARYPVEFQPEEKYTYKRPIPNWDGAEWPEKIPICAGGPKFFPKYLKAAPPKPVISASTSTTGSPKPRKPKKPGTRDDPICMFASNSCTIKPQTSTRMLILRAITELNDLHVPPFFQLSIFFKKIVLEFKRYKFRVEFNELYYELIRICSRPEKTPACFSHDSIMCHTCLCSWEGAESSIITLMQHFFEKHHQVKDWRKDMLLMPGPPDILDMFQKLNDRQMEYRWDQRATEHQLDTSSAREKMTIADQNGDVLCPMEQLKNIIVLKQGTNIFEGIERKNGELHIRDENNSMDRKRKREAGEAFDEDVQGEGSDKGKESDGSEFSFEDFIAESEDWELGSSADSFGEFDDDLCGIDSETWVEDDDQMELSDMMFA